MSSEPDDEAPGLQPHVTIPMDVRQRVSGLVATMESIRRVLTAPSARPETVARAKDEVKALWKEAASLWSIL